MTPAQRLKLNHDILMRAASLIEEDTQTDGFLNDVGQVFGVEDVGDVTDGAFAEACAIVKTVAKILRDRAKELR